VTCSIDSLRARDLDSRLQLVDNWQEGKGIMAIALSPDGKKVVGRSWSAVKLWDTDTGKVMAEWTGHTQAVKSVCWNRDGGRVLSGSYDGTARVWDVKSGKTILEFKPGLNAHSATYLPDQAIVVTGGESEEFITIWDAKAGKRIKNLKGHTDSVRCLAWTPNGSSIKTWNTTTWQQIAILAAHTDIVSCIQHCNISEWPDLRKRIIRWDSTIMEPREWPAHMFASPTCKHSVLLVNFGRWKTTSHRLLGQRCIHVGCPCDS
jgi:WD40 repeat protein